MINAIFAVDAKGGIGKNGGLPWHHIPGDLENFKRITHGHIVVMGRKTWDSPDMPSPLPGRVNAVVTRTKIDNDNVHIVSYDSIDQTFDNLRRTYPEKEIFVIGGKNSYCILCI